ncbi:MAG: dihydrolipoyl dehydrogenase [Myxococcaceae bacterium]|nr:dihydrolipoyl dehydrogenase [Myxococcaceae bacterium]
MDSASTEVFDVDVAVMGAGTAGLAAYRAAAAVSPKVLMIEGGIHGTTCARVGCMPSKLLIAAGDAAYHAKHAAPFGVHATVTIDGRAVLDRVRRERDRFVGFVIDSIESIPAGHKLRGRARFTEPGVLHVERDDGAGGQPLARVNARAIVIATGSSPYVPPMFEGIRDRLVVNDDVFAWETLPSSVAVFGAGVIGLELGQALSRLGVRVSVFGRSNTVGPLTDPVVKQSALAAFREEMPVYPDATVRQVRRVEEGVEITYADPEGVAKVETFAFALVAAGRRANLGGIGLEHAGLKLDARGAPVCDRTTLQCEGTSVFIAGDASDDVPLLHEAADEGKIAGENAARYPEITAGVRRSLLAITFTEPQIAVVGATLASLSRNAPPEREVVTGEIEFADQGRSRVMLQNRGIGHVYADRATGRFLGAELVGPRVEHLGHLLAWAHQQGLTIDDMLAMPFYHPVVEEGLRTALRDAASKITKR